MQTLIIDNHTKHLSELVSLFQNVTILKKEELVKGQNFDVYDAIVFSGGSDVPTVLRHPNDYILEIEIIKNSKIPIIGICLGAEIIVQAFGGELVDLGTDHRGNVDLEITNNDFAEFLGNKNITVNEAHSIGINKIPNDFSVYAVSDHGAEIIKHKSRPIIGFQFHPEISQNPKIIEYFLNK